jgi:hypothetical protein
MTTDTKICRALQAMGITLESMRGTTARPDWPADFDHWICRIDYKGRSMVTTFSKGPGLREKPAGGGDPRPVPPRLVEVLSCLVSDANTGRGSFEDYCNDFGVDPDSRKEHATWLACKQTATELDALLGDVLVTVEEAVRDF